MALLRGIITVWVCAVGLAAQIPDYNLWGQILNSGLINDAPTQSQNKDVSEMFAVLVVNNTRTKYKMDEAADAIFAACLNRTWVTYIHGFIASSDSEGTKDVENNVLPYLQAIGGCLVLFDHYYYSHGGIDMVGCYNNALAYYYDLALKICEVLKTLFRKGFSMCKLQMIGHSLGAQMGAIVSECFYNGTGVKLPFIKGCDPAGPGFKKFSSKAQSTLAFLCNAAQFGIDISKCEVDTILCSNGGVYQKGCYAPVLTEVLPPASSFCSHLACQKICSLPAFKQGKWMAHHCSSDKNCKNRISDGTEPFLVDFVNTTKLGKCYFVTESDDDILVIPSV